MTSSNPKYWHMKGNDLNHWNFFRTGDLHFVTQQIRLLISKFTFFTRSEYFDLQSPRLNGKREMKSMTRLDWGVLIENAIPERWESTTQSLWDALIENFMLAHDAPDPCWTQPVASLKPKITPRPQLGLRPCEAFQGRVLLTTFGDQRQKYQLFDYACLPPCNLLQSRWGPATPLIIRRILWVKQFSDIQ